MAHVSDNWMIKSSRAPVPSAWQSRRPCQCHDDTGPGVTHWHFHRRRVTSRPANARLWPWRLPESPSRFTAADDRIDPSSSLSQWYRDRDCHHLEPCKTYDIVGRTTISLYTVVPILARPTYDIVGHKATTISYTDIDHGYRSLDLQYRRTRYCIYRRSTWKTLISGEYDIVETSISKIKTTISVLFNIVKTMISKNKTSISVQNFCRASESETAPVTAKPSWCKGLRFKFWICTPFDFWAIATGMQVLIWSWKIYWSL